MRRRPKPTPPLPRLQPFISYYGSKWKLAPDYPPPEHDVVVEPFAGGAGYSVLHHSKRVVLIDSSPELAAMWGWLIRAEPSEITSLPDLAQGQTVDDLKVPSEAKTLIGFWLCKAAGAPRLRWNEAPEGGESWPEKYPNSTWWSARIRERIAMQLQHIKGWRSFCADYSEAERLVVECVGRKDRITWFVDPPYQKSGGVYPQQVSDYERLGAWCRDLRGQVLVCEGGEASWLPFRPLKEVSGIKNKPVKERLWWARDGVEIAFEPKQVTRMVRKLKQESKPNEELDRSAARVAAAELQSFVEHELPRLNFGDGSAEIVIKLRRRSSGELEVLVKDHLGLRRVFAASSRP